MSRRVVVTGLGLVTPFGLGASHNWIKIMNSISAVKALKEPEFSKFPCRVAARVPTGEKETTLQLSSHFSEADLRHMTKATAYACIAAREAITESRWQPSEEEDFERTGVAVGLGMNDLEEISKTGDMLKESYRKVSPYFIPKLLANTAAGQISIEHGFRGPNHAVSTACATGCHAIGDAFRLIKHGHADVMVCGGTEAGVTPLGIAGFCRVRALSTKFNDQPEEASRPFDSKRDGFVMGEGAGIVVLEDYKHAVARKANILAEILGYGMSGDAFHVTAPRDDGKGALNAMKNALKEANVEPALVGYVNAHATSTPKGDLIELRAIEEVFESKAEKIPVTSNKGAIGHLMGAAGAVETIFTILSCHTAYIPSNLNLLEPPSSEKVDFVPMIGKVWMQDSIRRIALCNSFGFGGTNACLCISSCDLL